MRPLLAPDAFVRTYLGEAGRFWVIVRRPGRARQRIDAETRAILNLCDGGRRPAQIARAAAEQVPRLLSAMEVERRLVPLLRSGVLIDLDTPPSETKAAPPPSGLRLSLLDDESAASLKVVPAPSTGVGCHGRGGCCSLYDRLRLDGADAGRIAAAFAETQTPGGLSVTSALIRERADEEVFGLAVSGGRCVLVEADGGCGVHRRLGAAGKPGGCRTFPLRDVKCGDELHVGLAVECRCTVDFAGDDPRTLWVEGQALLERRRRARSIEEVAEEVPLAAGRTVSRDEYSRWRAAAADRLSRAGDTVEWALAEATARGATDRPQDHFAALQRWLAFEAKDTAQLYDAGDLQRRLFAWSESAAGALLVNHAHPPTDGEELAARQLLHTHGLLRSSTVATALTSLALRLQLARAGARLPIADELLPIVCVEYLGRVYGLRRIFE